MPVSAETLQMLMQSGLQGDALLEVVASIDRDMAAQKPRSAGAERQARYRQRQKMSQSDVTSDASPLRNGHSHIEHASAPAQACATSIPEDIKTLPSGEQKTDSDARAGIAAVEALEALEDLPDTAAAVHAAAVAALQVVGFDVQPEFHVGVMDNGFGGRIDIAGTLEGGRVGIELDARKPRRRSIAKLQRFSGFRIVGLRGVAGDPEPGIDAMVRIDVRIAADEERADKRTINRPSPVTSWAPSADLESFARNLGIGSSQYAREISKLRDWAIGNGISKKDWDATARNWLRRSADDPKFVPSTGPPGEVLRFQTPQEIIAQRTAQRAAGS